MAEPVTCWIPRNRVEVCLECVKVRRSCVVFTCPWSGLPWCPCSVRSLHTLPGERTPACRDLRHPVLFQNFWMGPETEDINHKGKYQQTCERLSDLGVRALTVCRSTRENTERAFLDFEVHGRQVLCGSGGWSAVTALPSSC